MVVITAFLTFRSGCTTELAPHMTRVSSSIPRCLRSSSSAAMPCHMHRQDVCDHPRYLHVRYPRRCHIRRLLMIVGPYVPSFHEGVEPANSLSHIVWGRTYPGVLCFPGHIEGFWNGKLHAECHFHCLNAGLKGHPLVGFADQSDSR